MCNENIHKTWALRISFIKNLKEASEEQKKKNKIPN